MTYFEKKPGMECGDVFYDTDRIAEGHPLLRMMSQSGWWMVSAIYQTEISAIPVAAPENEAILLMQGTTYIKAGEWDKNWSL